MYVALDSVAMANVACAAVVSLSQRAAIEREYQVLYPADMCASGLSAQDMALRIMIDAEEDEDNDE